MRKLLNTLYVTLPNAYLRKDGMNVVISVEQEDKFRIPIINIESIVVFGYMGISPGLMNLCCENGVSVTFLTNHGKFISRLQGPTRGNVYLRKRQYEMSDTESDSLNISKILIAGKIQNYRNILKRHIRDYGENNEVEEAINNLENRKRYALKSTDFQNLLGHEGMASNIYFSIFPHLIRVQNPNFKFEGRTRRPPKDPVNAMLSFAYTLLTYEMAAALESVGLDPYVGFMHKLRPGRISLALDLIEEFRGYLGDRFVLSLINRKQISEKDFMFQGENGVIMTDKGRKTFITAWQTRKKDIITHPYLNEKIEIGLLPYAQAMMLARYIRKDIDNYPVFIIS